MNRIILIIGIVVVIGGAIQLFSFDELDVCDNDELIENLTESIWKTKKGINSISFKENGTFLITKNRGYLNLEGTYELLNDCHLLFPNAKKGSEYDGVINRHIKIYIDGSENIEIDFTNKRFNSFNLKSVGTMLKESDFPKLTK